MNAMSQIRPGVEHIAIVMHDFSTGGSERIAIRLANQWARTGRRVTILCGTIDGPARALIAPEVVIVTVWPEIRRSMISRLLLGLAFADCIKALQPDLIFVPGNFHIPVVAALALRLGRHRPAIVCKLSNPLAIRSIAGQALMAPFIRFFGGAIDGFVVMADSLREDAMRIFDRTAIRVIREPNIDPRQADYARKPPAVPTIVCAGRLVAQKNFALAIEAFARIAPQSDARLLILGEGERRGELELQVDRLGLRRRVSFTGHVADIRPVLAEASLFLLCSRYEGYPAVLIEALAAGLPVVTTHCSPAIGEIMLHPSFGRIVPQKASAIAEAVIAALQAASPEPAHVAALINHHRIDRVAAQYLDLFDMTVARRGHMPARPFSTEPVLPPPSGSAAA